MEDYRREPKTLITLRMLQILARGPEACRAGMLVHEPYDVWCYQGQKRRKIGILDKELPRLGFSVSALTGQGSDVHTTLDLITMTAAAMDDFPQPGMSGFSGSHQPSEAHSPISGFD